MSIDLTEIESVEHFSFAPETSSILEAYREMYN